MASLRRPAAFISRLRPTHPAHSSPSPALPLPLALRSFTQHLSRPRLPPLLRPSTPTSTPPRRLISAQTKAYLLRESLIAARIVTYGYSLLFAGALIATTALLLHTENAHPTPPSLPWRARIALTLSRTLTLWSSHRAATTHSLRVVLEELELCSAPENPAWIHAHVHTLQQLAGILELDDDVETARGLWQRVFDTADAEPGARVAAGLRVAKIAEFQGDDEAAFVALEGAVGVAEKKKEEAGEALLRALTEMAVFRARRGEAEAALELLTRVLGVRRATAAGDPCAEAATMTYIGEVLFALGERREGVAWSKEAFGRSAGLAELRGKCRECAIVAGRNLSAMAALMEEEEAAAAAAGRAGKKQKRAGRFSGFFAKTETETAAAESAEKWEDAVRALEQIRVSKDL